jgi:hypothetical protein
MCRTRKGCPFNTGDCMDRFGHDIAEILLKVALNTINQTNQKERVLRIA